MEKRINKKTLIEVPKRKWDEELHGVKSVYVIPNGKKHDSGFACMDFVAKIQENNLVGFGGYCDDVSFVGNHFRMDCEYPSKIIHIWNINGFTITHDLSSISFIEEDK